MGSPSRFGWSSLAAFFLLFLSLFNIATASPLPEDPVNKALSARAQTLITEKQYTDYVKKYFTATNRFLFYTGESEVQVKAFMAKNPGYNYFGTVFNAYDKKHPWYSAFNEETQMDDAEASSTVLAKAASGQVMVFGGIEYKTAGATSFFTVNEVAHLHQGIKDRRITTIHHMAKDATSTSQVMAKEDGTGKITYQTGYKAGDKNASGAFCKRAKACDAPKLNPKPKRPNSKTPANPS